MSRQYTKVSSTLYNSKKFRRLKSPFEKLVYIYLLISPSGNSGGCFEQPTHLAIAELDCSIEDYTKAMDSLSRELIAYDHAEETVFIHNWFEFNPLTNGRHAIGAVDQIARSAKGELKNKALQELRIAVMHLGGEKDGKACSAALQKIDTLLKAYAEPIPTKTIPEEDQKKTRPEKEEEARATENSFCPETSAGDLKAALVPSDGGEEGMGKTRGSFRDGGSEAYQDFIQTGKTVKAILETKH